MRPSRSMTLRSAVTCAWSVCARRFASSRFGTQALALHRADQRKDERGGRGERAHPHDPGRGTSLQRRDRRGLGGGAANRRHQARLHLRRARGVRRRFRRHADQVGGGAQVFEFGARLGIGEDERVDARAVGDGQDAERRSGDQLEHRVAIGSAVHCDTVSPSTSRRRRSPVRMRVLTVPSGVPVRRAISSWVTPPKNPISIGTRWVSSSEASASRTRCASICAKIVFVERTRRGEVGRESPRRGARPGCAADPERDCAETRASHAARLPSRNASGRSRS